MTIGKFYRVTGESTQLRGVTPDIVLPSPISTEDVGESVLEHALPWDRIAAVPFRALLAEPSAGADAGDRAERSRHAQCGLPVAAREPGDRSTARARRRRCR